MLTQSCALFWRGDLKYSAASEVLERVREDASGLDKAVGKAGQRRRMICLWIVFTSELIASLAAQLPSVYSFSTFVFYDPGSFLCADWLVAQHFTPTVDFGYPYGLLSLIFGRVVFALVGRTPAAYLAATLLLESVTALGLARLAVRWHWAVVVLLAVAIPHALQPAYLALTHPLEAVLLVHAIADLFAGKRPRALALATACVFVKPSMAYALGLALVVLLAASLRRERRPGSVAHFIAPFVPATLTGLACAAVSALYFGWRPLANSVLPLVGIKSYVALDFGFFGNGKTFWWPEAHRFVDFARYYATTPAGFWLLASLLLGVWGVVALSRSRRATNAPERETLVVLAALHFFFIFVMFAWPGSWTYYSYLLVAGVCVGLQFSERRWWALATLLLLALTGLTQTYQASVNNWRYSERTSLTIGLWADGQQRDEWSRVIELGRRCPLLFLHNGCANLFFPEMQSPQAYFLSPAMQTPREIASLRQQIEQASVVVSFNHAAVLDAWCWPELADQRAQFETTWRGLYLTIHERKKPVLIPVRKTGRPTSYRSTTSRRSRRPATKAD